MPKLPGRGGIVAARPRPPRHIGPNGVRYRTRRVVRAPVGGVVGAGAGGTVKSGIGTGGAASLFEILFASVFLADMGDVLEAVSSAAKTFLEMNNLTIDNATFKLFYRGTTVVLFASAFFSTAQQLFGEPIRSLMHICHTWGSGQHTTSGRWILRQNVREARFSKLTLFPQDT